MWTHLRRSAGLRYASSLNTPLTPTHFSRTVVIVQHSAGKHPPKEKRRKPRKVAHYVPVTPDSLLQSPISGIVEESHYTSELPAVAAEKITSAEFIKSSVSVSACPKESYPEFAIIGRSNVGKSSLINLLTGRKNLALISKTPGKTRCINHFLINKSWYLVDLPGYGYARVQESARVEWNAFTRAYFAKRSTLANVFLLVDASIPPMPLDVYCANWLGESEVPFTVVFTKVDKRKSGVAGPRENVEQFKRMLSETWETLPMCFATSARLGDGRVELLKYEPVTSPSHEGLSLRYIAQLTRLFKKHDPRAFGLGGRFTQAELEDIRRSVM